MFYIKAYKKIGDDDAVYGCGSSHILDPQSRISHYELTGNWQNVLLSYDFLLSSGNEDATGGVFVVAFEVWCIQLIFLFKVVDLKEIPFHMYQSET